MKVIAGKTGYHHPCDKTACRASMVCAIATHIVFPAGNITATSIRIVLTSVNVITRLFYGSNTTNMKLQTLFLLLLFSGFHVNAQQKRALLSYDCTIDPGKGILTVTLQLKGNKTGETIVELPNSWGGLEHLYRNITDIDTRNTAGLVRHTQDSAKIILKHKPSALLNLQYTLHNALVDSVPDNGEAYLPIIKKNYFHLIGTTFLLIPEADSSLRYDVKMKWQGIPASWSLVNSFIDKTEGKMENLSADNLVSSLWAGGDFRSYHLSINNRPVYFAIRGQWHFKDSAMFDMISKTISYQRKFWNDSLISRFTITLIPLLTHNMQSYSYQGTALTNCFASFATTNPYTQPFSLLYLYNHELMHHWIGHTIRSSDPEELLYWFSEGFTDYFTYLNLYKNGFTTNQQYQRSIDSILSLHYGNPVHESPNSLIREKFWVDPVMQKLPYNRGFVLALYMDAAIRNASSNKASLKTLVLDLLAEARKSVKISRENFLPALKKYWPGATAAFYEKYIENGKFIELEEWNRVTSGNFELREVKVFAYGFTTDKGGILPDAKIVSVDSMGNAAQAGLKEGDVIRGFNFYNNPFKESELTVIRNGEKIKLRFYPAKTVSVPQMKAGNTWLQ